MKGFYWGGLSPLIGSTIYRGVQFSVFDAVFTFYEGS